MILANYGYIERLTRQDRLNFADVIYSFGATCRKDISGVTKNVFLPILSDMIFTYNTKNHDAEKKMALTALSMGIEDGCWDDRCSTCTSVN
jgi:hypothetical protein